MAEGLGWFRLAWHLTCSCFTFTRIHTRFEKSCLLHFNGKWKQDQLIFVAVIHNNSWDSRARYTDQNAPISDVETLSPLQFVHLICIWIHFRAFAKFEINFRNPLIGCQCFDFVCPKARPVRPNWRTRSNFVRPESRSVHPGRNDALWIQCCCMHFQFRKSQARKVQLDSLN